MGVLLDIHDGVLQELLGQMVPLSTGSYNPLYPDVTLLLPTMTVGIQRKKTSELVGAMDACELQLRTDLEQASCDYLCLLVEGGLRPAPDGGTYCYEWRKDTSWNTGVEATVYGSMSFARRHHKQSYKGIMQFFSRLWALGIPVIRTEDTETTAIAIAAIYTDLSKPEGDHKTFQRLIRERYWLSETDLKKRKLAEFLLGLPGVGEELALSLADAYPDFDSLYSHLKEDPKAVAKTMLRGGKRSIGPAAVSKIKEFLHATSTSS